MYFPLVPGEKAGSDTEDGVILNVAVACEDSASALRAQALFEQIQWGLPPDFEIQSSFWRFDEMEIPELRARVEAVFAGADVVVISHRPETLSSGLPSYLEAILPQKGAQPRALVTLDGSERTTANSNASAEYFREASAKAGVAFFSEAEWTRNSHRYRSYGAEV
ncbi:MAG: hypothetical protein L0Z50_13760 [Verrucomicrobiales bacterium]|nr:hypothetical protein [Verrucomicrobiales bacterium]